VAEGTIPKGDVEDVLLVVSVFIHWQATDKKKIYDYNYQATKLAIERAIAGEPTVDDVLARKDEAKHPFA
jgi:5,6,7,8-tetrahydromethanopterin hydro-lyase